MDLDVARRRLEVDGQRQLSAVNFDNLLLWQLLRNVDVSVLDGVLGLDGSGHRTARSIAASATSHTAVTASSRAEATAATEVTAAVAAARVSSVFPE